MTFGLMLLVAAEGQIVALLNILLKKNHPRGDRGLSESRQGKSKRSFRKKRVRIPEEESDSLHCPEKGSNPH